MKYTPRRIAAWLEVMERINAHDTADRITEMQAGAQGSPKEMRSYLRKLREQL
jgi:hypothetical protein